MAQHGPQSHFNVFEKEPITDLSFLNPYPKCWSAFRSLNGRVGVKKVSGNWEVSKQLCGRTPASRAPASRAEGATMGRGVGAGQDPVLAGKGDRGLLQDRAGLIPTSIPSSKIVPDIYLNE